MVIILGTLFTDDVSEILLKLVYIKNEKYFRNNIVNICSGKPVRLIDYLKFIEKLYGKKCKTKKVAKQKIEIFKTHGSNTKIKKLVKKNKFIDFKVGLNNTVNWFKSYYF